MSAIVGVSMAPFSVSSARVRACKLTLAQRRLFDAIWDRHTESGDLLPIRSLPQVFGKSPPTSWYSGLDGGLIYEETVQGVRGLRLTVHGALLTGQGGILAAWLVRLLGVVRHLYEEDVYIKDIDSSLIQERLALLDHDCSLLLALLQLSPPSMLPFFLSGRALDGRSWSISVTDEVINLYRSDNLDEYLDGRLDLSYQPDLPWSEDERLKAFLSGQTSNSRLAELLFPKTGAVARDSLPYVDPQRLVELRGIKSERFDCTRLVKMCEELNESAADGSAHAVAFLTRAILDHVPPIFGFQTFAEVASQYGGNGKSFRRSLERLQDHSRHVADRLLHMPIRDRELVPTLTEVSLSVELEGVLAEICRLSKSA